MLEIGGAVILCSLKWRYKGSIIEKRFVQSIKSRVERHNEPRGVRKNVRMPEVDATIQGLKLLLSMNAYCFVVVVVFTPDQKILQNVNTERKSL